MASVEFDRGSLATLGSFITNSQANRLEELRVETQNRQYQKTLAEETRRFNAEYGLESYKMEKDFAIKDRELGQVDRELGQKDVGLRIDQQNADSNTMNAGTNAYNARTNRADQQSLAGYRTKQGEEIDQGIKESNWEMAAKDEEKAKGTVRSTLNKVQQLTNKFGGGVDGMNAVLQSTSGSMVRNTFVNSPTFRAEVFSHPDHKGNFDEGVNFVPFQIGNSGQFAVGGKNKNGETVYLSKNGKVVKDTADEAVLVFDAYDVAEGFDNLGAWSGFEDTALAADTLRGAQTGNRTPAQGGYTPGGLLNRVKQSTKDVDPRLQAPAEPGQFAPIDASTRSPEAMGMSAAKQLGLDQPSQIATLEGASSDQRVRDTNDLANAITAGFAKGDQESTNAIAKPLDEMIEKTFKKEVGSNKFTRIWNDITNAVPEWDNPDEMRSSLVETIRKDPAAFEEVVGKPVSQWAQRDWTAVAGLIAEQKTKGGFDWKAAVQLGAKGMTKVMPTNLTSRAIDAIIGTLSEEEKFAAENQ